VVVGIAPVHVDRPGIAALAVVPGGAFAAGSFATHRAMFCDRGSSGRHSPPKGVEVAEA